MRVITGTAKGKHLKELPGMDTRPTTDRVKEGLFNVIQFDIEGRKILDLFAGTGQLGIECLSRGAAFCDFVDSAPAAMKIVKENVTACRLADKASFHQKDFSAFLNGVRGKYDLIFLDPPYASGNLERALEKITAIDIVSGNGIIVCESPVDHILPELPGCYVKTGEYRYGKIKATLYRRSV
jgi:16S rRNA (guanine(966)-N(2))-methyltransferase RsmD